MITVARAFADLAASEKLPPGHYGKKWAREKLDSLYAYCFAHETRLYNKWLTKKTLRYFTSVQEAANFCGYLCAAIGTSMIKRVVCNSSSVIVGSAGCYSRGEIHMPSRCMSVRILIHETAHHVKHVEKICGSMHGKEFVNILELLYEAAASWFKEMTCLQLYR